MTFFFKQFRVLFRISRTRHFNSAIQRFYHLTRKFRTMKRRCLVAIRATSSKDRKCIAAGSASISTHMDRHLNAFLDPVNCLESLTENTRPDTELDWLWPTDRRSITLAPSQTMSKSIQVLSNVDWVNSFPTFQFAALVLIDSASTVYKQQTELTKKKDSSNKTFLLINQIIDFGRIAWQEFKGGGDITEGGIMVLMDRDKRNCSEPHRVHGSLVFRDGEPKEGEKKWVDIYH